MSLDIKKILCFAFLFILHQSVFAGGGIGFTVGAGSESWTDNDDTGVVAATYPLGGSRRLSNYGLVVDSNISRNSLFNYRFSGLWETNKPDGSNGLEFTGLSMTHDFGFGIIRNRDIRLWLGPRIQFGFSEDLDQTAAGANTVTEGSVFSIGFGPVMGLNINSMKVISLSITYAYLYRTYYGDYWTEDASIGGLISKQDIDIDSAGSYINVSLMFKLYK